MAQAKLDAMQKALFEKAKAFRDANTFEVDSNEEMKKRADDGFLLAHWCDRTACEARIKEETGGVTTRNRPFDLKQEPGSCVVCGKPEPRRVGLVEGVLTPHALTTRLSCAPRATAGPHLGGSVKGAVAPLQLRSSLGGASPRPPSGSPWSPPTDATGR